MFDLQLFLFFVFGDICTARFSKKIQEQHASKKQNNPTERTVIKVSPGSFVSFGAVPCETR